MIFRRLSSVLRYEPVPPRWRRKPVAWRGVVISEEEVLQTAVSAAVIIQVHEGPKLEDWATEWKSEDLTRTSGVKKNRDVSGINVGRSLLVHPVTDQPAGEADATEALEPAVEGGDEQEQRQAEGVEGNGGEEADKGE